MSSCVLLARSRPNRWGLAWLCSVDVGVVGLFEEAAREVVGPLHGPRAQSGDGGMVEAVGGEGFVVGPLGAGEVRLEVLALEAATVWRRPNSSSSAFVQRREVANTSIRSRGAPRSARARTLVPITSSSARTGPYGLWATGRQKISLRMSTSHSCPVAGSVTVKRADSGAVSSACTFQPRAVRPLRRVRPRCPPWAPGSRWRHQGLGWVGSRGGCALTAYPPVRTRGYGEPRENTSARSRVCSSGMSVTRLPANGRQARGRRPPTRCARCGRRGCAARATARGVDPG